MGMGKAGQGGTELAVLDATGGITGALRSASWRGLWPSRVILTDSLTELPGPPQWPAQGSGQLDQSISVLSIFLSAAVGEQIPGQEHRGHYLQLFPIQPKA